MKHKMNRLIGVLLLLCLFFVGCKDDDTLFLSLNVTEKSIMIDDSFQFVAKVQDTEKDYVQKVSWSLINMKDSDGNDASVAVIDENGIVTAMAVGTAMVKAEIETGQYALANIIVEKRVSPSSGMEFSKEKMYLSIDTPIADTLELIVDQNIIQYFDLKLSSDNEKVIRPELWPGNTEGTYKIALHRGGEEGVAIVSVKAGDYSITAEIYVGVKLYLSFEEINMSLGEPSITALSSFTFNVGTTGVIPIHFVAIPDDKAHLDDIDFYVSYSGQSVFKKVAQRIEGKIVYIDVEVGKEKGDAVIVLEALGNKVTAECTVMDKNDVDVTSIKFSENEIETTLRNVALYETVIIKPLSAASLWPPVWNSSDESVATVNEDGIVSFKRRGQVMITATSKDKSDYCTITALLEVMSLNFTSNLKDQLFMGERTQWSVLVNTNFEDSSGLLWEWESSDTSVATVDENGLITALSAGTAIIRVSITDDLGKKHTLEKGLTVLDDSNVRIYDLDFNIKTFNYINNGTSLDVYDPQLPADDTHYYTFTFMDISEEPLLLEKGKTYHVGTHISKKSFVEFWEFSGEKANIQSGTLTVGDNHTLIFDLIAREGNKDIIIKGAVELSDE